MTVSGDGAQRCEVRLPGRLRGRRVWGHAIEFLAGTCPVEDVAAAGGGGGVGHIGRLKTGSEDSGEVSVVVEKGRKRVKGFFPMVVVCRIKSQGFIGRSKSPECSFYGDTQLDNCLEALHAFYWFDIELVSIIDNFRPDQSPY